MMFISWNIYSILSIKFTSNPGELVYSSKVWSEYSTFVYLHGEIAITKIDIIQLNACYKLTTKPIYRKMLTLFPKITKEIKIN